VALGSQRCPPAHPEAQRRKVFGMHPSERKEERKKERNAVISSKQLTR